MRMVKVLAISKHPAIGISLHPLVTNWIKCHGSFHVTAQNGSFLRGCPPLSNSLFRLRLASDKRAVQNTGHENRLCPRFNGRIKLLLAAYKVSYWLSDE